MIRRPRRTGTVWTRRRCASLRSLSHSANTGTRPSRQHAGHMKVERLILQGSGGLGRDVPRRSTNYMERTFLRACRLRVLGGAACAFSPVQFLFARFRIRVVVCERADEDAGGRKWRVVKREGVGQGRALDAGVRVWTSMPIQHIFSVQGIAAGSPRWACICSTSGVPFENRRFFEPIYLDHLTTEMNFHRRTQNHSVGTTSESLLPFPYCVGR